MQSEVKYNLLMHDHPSFSVKFKMGASAEHDCVCTHSVHTCTHIESCSHFFLQCVWKQHDSCCKHDIRYHAIHSHSTSVLDYRIITMRDLLLSFGLHVFLLSNVLNSDVCVVYSVCECTRPQLHMHDLWVSITNWVHVDIKTWLVSK